MNTSEPDTLLQSLIKTAALIILGLATLYFIRTALVIINFDNYKYSDWPKTRGVVVEIINYDVRGSSPLKVEPCPVIQYQTNEGEQRTMVACEIRKTAKIGDGYSIAYHPTDRLFMAIVRPGAILRHYLLRGMLLSLIGLLVYFFGSKYLKHKTLRLFR